MWDYKPYTRALGNSVMGLVFVGLSSFISACGADNPSSQNARTLDSVVAEEDSDVEDTFDAYTARDVGVPVDLGSDVSSYDSGSKEDTYNPRLRRDVGVDPDLNEDDDLERDFGLVKPDLTEEEDTDSGRLTEEDTDSGRSQELRAIACPETSEFEGGPYRIRDPQDPHYGLCKYEVPLNSFFEVDGCRSTGSIRRYLFDRALMSSVTTECRDVSSSFVNPGIYHGQLCVEGLDTSISCDDILYQTRD